MSTLNKVILIGNLGKDPEIKQFEGGGLLARINLATSDFYRNNEGTRIEHTEWHQVVASGKLAEIVQQQALKKGQLVCVEGRLRTRHWDDKEGRKHYITEILAETFNVLGKKIVDDPKPSPAENKPPYEQGLPPVGISESTDDLPF